MNSRRGANFRREERINVALPVTLQVGWRGTLEMRASTVDLSPQGLRLRTEFPLRLGQDVGAIVGEDGNHARSYRVVWVRKSESGRSKYELGLELLTQTNSAMVT